MHYFFFELNCITAIKLWLCHSLVRPDYILGNAQSALQINNLLCP